MRQRSRKVYGKASKTSEIEGEGESMVTVRAISDMRGLAAIAWHNEPRTYCKTSRYRFRNSSLANSDAHARNFFSCRHARQKTYRFRNGIHPNYVTSPAERQSLIFDLFYAVHYQSNVTFATASQYFTTAHGRHKPDYCGAALFNKPFRLLNLSA